MDKLTWIDTHIHVSDLGQDGSPRADLAGALVDVLDRDPADLRFVASCDLPYVRQMAGDPQAMWSGNRAVYEAVRRAPDRLYGSCVVNPRFLDESLRVMEACLGEWGFVQLGEMLPYMMGYRMDCDATERLVREAMSYDVPVQVHLGTYWIRGAGPSTHGMAQFEDLLGIVDRVPEARYVLAHAIGRGPRPAYVSWAGWYLDALAGVFPSFPPNFWVEIRDFHCPALVRAVAEVPTGRLLAGTDWTSRIGPPFQSYGTVFELQEAENPFPPRVASMVQYLRQAGASEEDIQRIASTNAAELLKLSL
jgi:predicted TIM-barrel fold metal-dependent hydrolase